MAEPSPPPSPESDARRPLGDQHWSRTRGERNRDALEYYQARSKAPGVAEGGAERNFYCMACDGVIPFDPTLLACPHCQAPIDPHVKRYFNWVEINEPAQSDARALLPIALAVLGGLALVAAALVWWLS
jgi:hypothetical protein